MMRSIPLFTDCGDSALMITLEKGKTQAKSRYLVALSDRISALNLAGYIEAVSGLSSLTVFYDPLILAHDRLVDMLRTVCSELADENEAALSKSSGAVWEIPVLLGGTETDLDDICNRQNMALQNVIDLFCSTSFTVYMLGFLPGFAYMGDLPLSLRMTRKATPNSRIESGSVAIADDMAAIYPLESPGGWWILGKTPYRMWDMQKSSYPLLLAGDQVRFVSIDKKAFIAIQQRIKDGWAPTALSQI